jgi:two-component system, cell cycle sensor histidine kinase and response regulator CckA
MNRTNTMQDATDYLKEALSSLPDPVCILTPDRRCAFSNQAFNELVRSVHPDTSLFWPRLSERNHDGETQSFFVSDTGEKIQVRLRITPLSDGAKIVRVLTANRADNSLEELHAQRLETLGMLAGGVAHDFNNLLTGILGHITYLKTILPPSGAHVESLSAIEHGARKSSLITQQILNFAKLDAGDEPATLELREVVTSTVSLLRGAISPEYNLRAKVPDNPVNVLGVESKLAQVIVNLAVNARDAVESNGFIEIGLELCDDADRLRRAYCTAGPVHGRFARLFVLDNGHGMSPEMQKRIFDPFFTTKQGKGTGLGLSTVATIVRSMGGALEVSSQEGVGTAVSVFIPISEGVSADTRLSGTREELRGGNERILIIDDETPVRNVLCLSLEHLGYSVEAAASGEEAIEKFQEAAGRFDLVILDMLMPELSGDQVFARLHKIDPNINILIISGFSSEQAVNSVLKHPGSDFIQKPFSIQDLSKKVRQCLER